MACVYGRGPLRPGPLCPRDRPAAPKRPLCLWNGVYIWLVYMGAGRCALGRCARGNMLPARCAEEAAAPVCVSVCALCEREVGCAHADVACLSSR